MVSSPDLVDYISFFEAEAKPLGPGIEWHYGVSFEVVRDSDRISATVAPDEGEFSFAWWCNGLLQVDVFLAGVTDWIIETGDNAERLVLKFDQPKLPYFILQLEPHVSVAWRVSWA